MPVDFVVNAMDHLAHLPDLDGQCFHLTDSRPFRTGEVLNIFSEAGHGPKMVLRFNSRLFNLIPGHLMGMLCNYPPVQRISHLLLAEYGIPASALSLINYPTRFDNRRTQKLLEPAGIAVLLWIATHRKSGIIGSVTSTPICLSTKFCTNSCTTKWCCSPAVAQGLVWRPPFG